MARWVNLFRTGRDKPLSRRPSTYVSEKDVTSLKVLVEKMPA